MVRIVDRGCGRVCIVIPALPVIADWPSSISKTTLDDGLIALGTAAAASRRLSARVDWHSPTRCRAPASRRWCWSSTDRRAQLRPVTFRGDAAAVCVEGAAGLAALGIRRASPPRVRPIGFVYGEGEPTDTLCASRTDSPPRCRGRLLCTVRVVAQDERLLRPRCGRAATVYSVRQRAHQRSSPLPGARSVPFPAGPGSRVGRGSRSAARALRWSRRGDLRYHRWPTAVSCLDVSANAAPTVIFPHPRRRHDPDRAQPGKSTSRCTRHPLCAAGFSTSCAQEHRAPLPCAHRGRGDAERRLLERICTTAAQHLVALAVRRLAPDAVEDDPATHGALDELRTILQDALAECSRSPTALPRCLRRLVPALPAAATGRIAGRPSISSISNVRSHLSCGLLLLCERCRTPANSRRRAKIALRSGRQRELCFTVSALGRFDAAAAPEGTGFATWPSDWREQARSTVVGAGRHRISGRVPVCVPRPPRRDA